MGRFLKVQRGSTKVEGFKQFFFAYILYEESPLTMKSQKQGVVIPKVIAADLFCVAGGLIYRV